MKDDSLSELGIIAQIKKLSAAKVPANITGIGDDCAVIPKGDGMAWVITTDALVEGNHFLMDKITPRQLGYKSVAVNVSDVAAMGARPKYLFLSVAFPKSLKNNWIHEFLLGINEACAKYDVMILGGDTTSGGSVFINITLMGEAPQVHIKYRKDAKVGDIIAVSEKLGASKLGLKYLLAGQKHPFINKHLRPEPNVELAIWLGQQTEVHAMMDISDGLGEDLEKMLQASRLGATIELTQIPSFGTPEEALASGEEYALLFTADPKDFPRLQESSPFPLYPFGIITENPSLIFTKNSQRIDISFESYRHF